MLRTAALTALASVLVSASSASAVTFFDGIFNNTDWTLTNVNNAAGAGSTSVGFQVLTGGNPNEYRRVRNSLVVPGPGAGAIFGWHMNNTAFYTPSSQGAIAYIDYSEDSINFTPTTVLPGNGQSTGLAIFQNGKFYRQQSPLLVIPYTNFSNWAPNAAPGLLATDFLEVNGSGNFVAASYPDFSASGTIMQFGFARGNSGNGGYQTDCGIDNWSVNVVPAPGAAALLGAGGLMAMRRRRR